MKPNNVLRYLALTLALLCALSLFACGGGSSFLGDDEDDDDDDDDDGEGVGELVLAYEEAGEFAFHIPENWELQEDGIGQATAHSPDGKCRVRLTVDPPLKSFSSAKEHADWQLSNIESIADADDTMTILATLTETKLGGQEAYTMTYRQKIGDESYTAYLTNREIFRYQDGKVYMIAFSPVGDACTEDFSFRPYEADINRIVAAFTWGGAPTNQPVERPLPGATTIAPAITDKSETSKPVTQVTEKPVTQAPVTQKPVTQAPVTQKPVTGATAPDVPTPDVPVDELYAAISVPGYFTAYAPSNWTTQYDASSQSWKVVAPDGVSIMQATVSQVGPGYTSLSAAEEASVLLKQQYGTMLVDHSEYQAVQMGGENAIVQFFHLKYNDSVYIQQGIFYCVRGEYLYSMIFTAWEGTSYTGISQDVHTMVNNFHFE